MLMNIPTDAAFPTFIELNANEYAYVPSTSVEWAGPPPVRSLT